jgi:hypothetical protein
MRLSGRKRESGFVQGKTLRLRLTKKAGLVEKGLSANNVRGRHWRCEKPTGVQLE